MAHEGHTRNDRMRAHCRDRHAHRRVVRDGRRPERRGDRTRGPYCSGGQNETRAVVWPLEA